MKASLLAAALIVLAACGSSSSTTAASCMSFTDLTATTAIVAFGGANGNAYVPRCATVTVSQEITFNGDFSGHPLSQTSGAAVIPSTSAGTSVTFSIPAAGTYDYQCDFHHAGGMTGAIKVVP
jgi:plastocyanin